ncbi:uncharacterized protein LOC128040500 [Gossypium raimondii]|uniref:uncharacterized protein LOC128040500 n=1 Tax=Gossypium raimondii TaxID=29730 RepID=UPI00227CF89A|nr:uncharacterized protein LOC128040500 [Gossypium raimondii]
MDQRLERLEQMQKEGQYQVQEKLTKIQINMREQMLESQRNMMKQLTQLLAGGLGKGKIPMINTVDDNEDPIYPLGFTPTDAQVQPQRVSVNIRPQYQTDTSAPINFHMGSGSNPGDNPANLVVTDLDDIAEIGRAIVEFLKQLEDRCKWLEDKALETADYYSGIDAKELSLVPDLVLPPKFKVPKFEKYNRTSCPEAHITMFCRRMTGYVNNDKLLIHYFQDSLTGAGARWYNQLNRA